MAVKSDYNIKNPQSNFDSIPYGIKKLFWQAYKAAENFAIGEVVTNLEIKKTHQEIARKMGKDRAVITRILSKRGGEKK